LTFSISFSKQKSVYQIYNTNTGSTFCIAGSFRNISFSFSYLAIITLTGKEYVK
jgi:hypothetical protein